MMDARSGVSSVLLLANFGLVYFFSAIAIRAVLLKTK